MRCNPLGELDQCTQPGPSSHEGIECATRLPRPTVCAGVPRMPCRYTGPSPAKCSYHVRYALSISILTKIWSSWQWQILILLNMKKDFSDCYLACAIPGMNYIYLACAILGMYYTWHELYLACTIPGRGRAAACTVSQRRAKIEPGKINLSMFQ